MTCSRSCQLIAAGAIAAITLGLWSVPQSGLKPSNIQVQTPLSLNHTGQSQICKTLATVLPHGFVSHEHPVFRETIEHAFAFQAREELPGCITQPSDAREVSLILETLTAMQSAGHEVKFVVRSGGHYPGPGHSSIRDGVLIDLGRIFEVTVSQDLKSVVIGSGARWGHVYRQLDNHALTVAGGRNSDVGVGGLSLGGGIWFYSPQVGMVCDTILEYEIVLANSTILRASESEHADPWRSLKGGSGNFGIVTRIVARTLPSTTVWAGFIYYGFGKVPKLVKAFYEFNRPEVLDKRAASPMLSLSYITTLSMKVACVNALYTMPKPWPKAWSSFHSIWPRWSTAKIRSVADAADEFSKNAPPDKRQHYATITIKNDYETLQAIPTLYDESIRHIKSVKGLTWTIVLQPLPISVTHGSSPNVLGLESRDRSDPTPILILICPTWRLAKDDEIVITAVRMLLDMLSQLAVKRGSADDFVYLNYASDYQNPFQGYGEANQRFLRETSRRYDPDRFFQRARYGGFKLDR